MVARVLLSYLMCVLSQTRLALSASTIAAGGVIDSQLHHSEVKPYAIDIHLEYVALDERCRE